MNMAPRSKFFAGYINDKEKYGPDDHPIHYIFSPCQKDHAVKPVIFWMMGGPGVPVLDFWFKWLSPMRLKKSGFRRQKPSLNKFANLVGLGKIFSFNS